MIFKDLEIYVLTRSTSARWFLTLAFVGLLVTGWYFLAFKPLKAALTHMEIKLDDQQTVAHEMNAHKSASDHAQQSVSHILKDAKSYTELLQDLMHDGFYLKKVETGVSEKNKFFQKTEIKIAFEGPFELFYLFLKNNQNRYIIDWIDLSITSLDKKIALDADLVLYEPL